MIMCNRGANLSPFGEIRRFHLEIGHSRESFFYGYVYLVLGKITFNIYTLQYSVTP